MSNPEWDAEDFAHLAESMHAEPTTERTADEVVRFATEGMDADHGGITLLRSRGRLETIVATDPIVEQVDELQYELAEGPCRDACWHRETLLVPNLAADPRWPKWGSKAAALGIGSVLAVELTKTDETRIGAVNLYWLYRREFSADDIAYASIFGRHAAVALANSLEEAGLKVALDARKLIGQAQGILMERHGLNETQAFDVLTRYSQDNNIKLRKIAERLVATRRLPENTGMGEQRLGTDESG